jgi:hypothetical protein
MAVLWYIIRMSAASIGAATLAIGMCMAANYPIEDGAKLFGIGSMIVAAALVKK